MLNDLKTEQERKLFEARYAEEELRTNPKYFTDTLDIEEYYLDVRTNYLFDGWLSRAELNFNSQRTNK